MNRVSSGVSGAPEVTIGANFEGSGIGIAGFFDPPDTDGAVGPGQFVELLNGIYRVYDKSGAVLDQMSLAQFWSSAGLPTPAFPIDPRVLYDPGSQHWFAASLDNLGVANHLLLAVSNTSDPTQGWQAVSISADPTGQSIADFTRLGVNEDGVYLSANLNGGVSPQTVIAAIPKADLLQSVPTVANAEVFTPLQTDTGPSEQPAVASDSSGAEPLLSSYDVVQGQLKISSVDLTTASSPLDVQDRFVDVPPSGDPPPAAQFNDATGLPASLPLGDARFRYSAILQDGKLFAVQHVDDAGHAALRWFEIGDPLTAPVVLDSGLIHPANLDVYYGSIAVNPLDQVVIGFSGSGPDSFPSSYAVAGTLAGDHLEFGDPILLRTGRGPYFGLHPELPTRWGDYSATTYDPSDPTHFWTIQEFAQGANAWSTQISELVFSSPAPIDAPTPAGNCRLECAGSPGRGQLRSYRTVVC